MRHRKSTQNFEILSQTLFMLIYANLFQNHKKKLVFFQWLTDFDFFCLFHLVELHETHKTSTQNYEIWSQSFVMLIYANLFNLFKNHKQNASFP